MDDRSALMAAIAANPDEDTPRLALADYLDEHGTAADQARAEYIRLEVKVATATDKGRKKLVAASGKLESKHRRAWLKPLGDISKAFLPEDYVDFERGLLKYTFFKTEDFLRNAVQQALPAALAAVGVEELCFHSPTKRVEELANSPALRFVARVQYPGADDAFLTALAASANAAHLSDLRFESVAFTDSGLKAFAASTGTANLTRLYLSTEGGLTSKKPKFTAAGLAALLNSDKLPWLTHFDLDVAPKFDVKPLFAAPGLAKLKSLQLTPHINVADLVACPHVTGLQSLCLIDADMTDADVDALVGPALANLKGLVLNLSTELSAKATNKLEKRFKNDLTLEYIED